MGGVFPNGPLLVGDIGGTNARLALAEIAGERVRLIEPLILKCADFPRAEDAIAYYLQSLGRPKPAATVLALAGPVGQGEVVSTNGFWSLSEAGLVAFGFAAAKLINDFAALALAAPRLGLEDLAYVGSEPITATAAETIAVAGAGTGFGVGAWVRGVGGQAAAATEGGHIGFAPVDELEIEILRLLSHRFGRVSIERILSGPGLVTLRSALAEIEGTPVQPMSPEAIVAEGRDGGDGLCRLTLDRFCAIYGSVAGDLALTFGARGGVYLGGGVAAGMVERLRASQFRERFVAKGRFEPYLAAIPTAVIVDPYAALRGAAFALPQSIQAGS
jgi:glucokinase